MVQDNAGPTRNLYPRAFRGSAGSPRLEMEHTMKTQSYEIGMVGLRVMRRSSVCQPDTHPPKNSVAFGAPGIEPRWTSSAKNGLGTAYHTSCRLWFTLSHGIVNEIYYPCVDAPNTRDFQFLISDGETFFHEEKRDLDHRIEYPEKDCVFYRLTNSERDGRYRLVKHVLTDPHRSVLLMHTKVEVLDKSLRGKLRLYALLAPHIARQGAGNSGWCAEISGTRL